jgi:hypothetical protein
MNAAIKTTELSDYVKISCGIRGDHRDEGYVVTSGCHHIILTTTKKWRLLLTIEFSTAPSLSTSHHLYGII